MRYLGLMRFEPQLMQFKVYSEMTKLLKVFSLENAFDLQMSGTFGSLWKDPFRRGGEGIARPLIQARTHRF
jgi:hypothetical protein